MTSLVIDSSIAVKWFLPEPYSSQARQILEGYETGAFSFLAPDLLYAEFGNIVWKKHLFHGLDADDAHRVIEEFRNLPFRLISAATLLEPAYQLAVTYKRSVYDSLYLALSVRENCQLITADERLVNAVNSSLSNIVWLANWP